MKTPMVTTKPQCTSSTGGRTKALLARDWVIDLDIKGFFDNLDHDLMMKAVRHHIQEPWALLYIERWLEAPVDDGREQVKRTRGTPQGE